MKSLWILALFLCNSSAWAGEAHVIDARAEQSDDGRWTIQATVQHDDEGWDHYADKWDILSPDGKVLDTRTLFHPHTPEPFTRSLPGAKIPPELKKIKLRAHDKVHGYGGREFLLTLP